MSTNNPKLLANICRWTARVLGALLVLGVVSIAIGEGMPNPLSQPLRVQIGFLGFGLILAGLLAGWRWDRTPALISLAGWGLFVAVAMKMQPNPFVLALAVPALLLLASARLRSRSEKQPLA